MTSHPLLRFLLMRELELLFVWLMMFASSELSYCVHVLVVWPVGQEEPEDPWCQVCQTTLYSESNFSRQQFSVLKMMHKLATVVRDICIGVGYSCVMNFLLRLVTTVFMADGLLLYRDFEWSPDASILSYWVPEVDACPARVCLIEIPSRNELRVRNLFNVADCKLHWQKSGEHLCVKVDRYAKKKTENNEVKYSVSITTVSPQHPLPHASFIHFILGLSINVLEDWWCSLYLVLQ